MFRQTVETRDIKYIDILVTPSQEDKVAMLSEMEELAAELNASADPTNIVRSCNSLLPYTGLAVKKSILPTEVANALDSVGVGLYTNLNLILVIIPIPPLSISARLISLILLSSVRFKFQQKLLMRPEN